MLRSLSSAVLVLAMVGSVHGVENTIEEVAVSYTHLTLPTNREV